MENEIEELLDKYSENVLKNIDKDNASKIINYIYQKNSNLLEDILNNYLDIFLIDYDEFVKKIELLNRIYDNKYFELVEEDLNYLEKLFYDYR